ncbi:hypothetical protein FOA52_003948 [Chlamydomonas sp. UWO 241]|nr:hypothetical protein FOA52_003948 [Chlamydomonas sp. UWO 241]
MSFDFLSWLAVFFLQAGLLGKGMYTMITLTDLEADNINPFDCAERINKLVAIELGAQAALTAILVLSQRWFAGAIHIGVCALLAHMLARSQVYMHAADAFKQLPTFKARRSIIFGIYCASFLLITYRLIESGLHSLLTPEGRMTAKKLFREAASSLHHY